MFEATGFPTNVIDEIEPRLLTILDVEGVQRRRLRPADPNGTIGIWANEWTGQVPLIGQWEPAISRYTFGIEALLKHTDEAEVRAQHTEFAKRIRRMLYRDEMLRLRLAALGETTDGITERTLKWEVRVQRFAANEIDGDFWYLSTTEFFLETETV